VEQKAKKSAKIKLYLLIGVLVLSLAGAATFGILLIRDRLATRQGQDFFAEMAIPMIERSAASPQQGAGEGGQGGDIDIDAPAQQAAFAPFVVDWDYHREQAPNIVGWIQNPGTVINYPIVQGTDNDFYLDHLPNGRRNAMGSIFLDYRHAADFSGQTILIYGHNMASGDKFSSLRRYTDRAFFEDHPTIYIFTPRGNFVIEIFAGYNIDTSVEHPPASFASEEQFNNFMDDLRRRSFIRSDFHAEFGDQLVYLVTCTYAGTTPWRTVIIGRLVPAPW